MTTVAEAWGLRCPDCGHDDELEIQVRTWAVLTPEGTLASDTNGSEEWDDASLCMCGICQHEGRVRDFKAAACETVAGLS
jgi:hypothetical protein